MKILNFGSLNIDYTYKVPHFVSAGETLSSTSMHTFPGGKGLNQSIALSHAGAAVYHAGAVGKDGLFLIDLLKESGVNTDNVAILEDERSGHTIIQNDACGDNCILLYGGANQCIDKDMIHQVLDQFEEGDYLVLQNEISNLNEIVEYAKQRGMIVILNPSPMNEKVLALDLNKIDFMILNEIEAGQLLNTKETDGTVLAEKFKAIYPNMKMLMTLGERGSIYMDSKQTVQQGIYKTKVVDTTAAGDTFSGYFLAMMIEGKSIKEAMEIAARAAGIAVSRNGAGVSIPERPEVL